MLGKQNTVNRKEVGVTHLASHCSLLEEKKKGVCSGWSTASTIIGLKPAKRQLIGQRPLYLRKPVNLDRALEGCKKRLCKSTRVL